jgi:hypothetical protein
MEWINVNTKLPNPYVVVLWYWPKQDTVLQGFLFYHHGQGENVIDADQFSYYFSLKDLTHWSAFEPPKDLSYGA